MVGMLQVMTWLGGLYLIVKGIEVLQIGIASNRESRKLPIVIGVATLALCVAGAVLLIQAQDEQAASIGSMPGDYGF